LSANSDPSHTAANLSKAQRRPKRSLHYDIAEPESYDRYVLDPSQKPPTPPATTSSDAQKSAALATGESTHRWDDPESDQRQVDKADFSRFDPPDLESKKSPALARGPEREKRAVWIVHGMGQQIPFETVDSLTRGILDAVKPQQPEPRLRTVKIGNDVLQRVELDVDSVTPEGRPHHYELHLYESYWAPKTEGVAKLTDVVSFLWDGGSRGLLNWLKTFKRAMFGGMADFSITFRTPFYLCTALAILSALTLINGIILIAAGAKTGVATLNAFKNHSDQLSAIATLMIAVAVSFGAVLFITDLCKPREVPKPLHYLISFVGWAGFIVTAAEILWTAAVMALIVRIDWKGAAASQVCGPGPSYWLFTKIRDYVSSLMTMNSCPVQGFATAIILGSLVLIGIAMFTRAVLRSSEIEAAGNWWLCFLACAALALVFSAGYGSVSLTIHRSGVELWPGPWASLQKPVWVWPFMIAFSAKVREILVQYVGDVAIYVQSNKLDRFDEVRDKIKTAARTVASAVFTAYKSHSSTEFLYKHIAVVGHSLGSVIVYDTVNRLMLDDWLSHNALNIAERTKAMVTFGSPLDKTAFLFTIQGSDTLHIRERLASTVQPLITNYRRFRKLKWINVYSHNDIVSGKLDFYDLPGFQDKTTVPYEAVHNIIDHDASVPLIAHVSYWNNKTVWRELLKAIAP
jgi:hypothetical protein